MNQVTLKVTPALLAGCTMVLKPSEIAPLSSLLFAEILQEAGFRTTGMYRNGWVAPNFGFGQGFEVYERPASQPAPPGVRCTFSSPRAAPPSSIGSTALCGDMAQAAGCRTLSITLKPGATRR